MKPSSHVLLCDPYCLKPVLEECERVWSAESSGNTGLRGGSWSPRGTAGQGPQHSTAGVSLNATSLPGQSNPAQPCRTTLCLSSLLPWRGQVCGTHRTALGRGVWGHVHTQEGPFHPKSPGMRQPGKTLNISTWQSLQLLRSNQSWVIRQFVQDANLPLQNTPAQGLCHELQAPSSSQRDSATGFSRSTHLLKTFGRPWLR